MQRLSDQSGGTVSLGIRHRSSIIYIETTRAHDADDFRPDIGATLPLLETAIGRAWFASCTDAEHEDACAWLRSQQSLRDADMHEIVTAVTASLKKRGFYISRGSFRPDVHAVAVPLKERVRGDLMMLNCGVLKSRLKPGTLEREIGPLLLQTASQIDRFMQQSQELCG